MSEKISALVEQVGNLTMQEAADMAEKWGISASQIQTAPVEAVEETKSTKTIWLTGFEDGKKIMVIKTIRQLMDLGLLEAKTFVEKAAEAKAEVKTDLEPEEADKIAKSLTENGGRVEIK